MRLNGRDPGVRAAAVAALGCVIASLVLFREALAGRALMAGLDYRALFYPFLEYASRTFRERGELPLWLPHLFGGVPFIASMNASVLYPTEIPAWMAGLSPPVFYAWDSLIHQVVAGAGAAALLSFEGLGAGGAVFGGFVYAFAGVTVSQQGVATVGFYRAVTLLPWLLLGLRAGVAGSWKGTVLAGVVVGLMSLTFAAQMLAFAFVWVSLLLALDLARAATSGRTRQAPGLRRTVLVLAGAAGLGAVLGAVWLLPAVQYYGACVRAAPGASFSLQWRFSAAQFVEGVWPGFWGRVAYASDTVYFGPHGSDMTTVYCGLVPLAFAVAGVAAAWRRRWPWLVAGLAALAWSFGPDTFLGRPVHALPGFGGFRGWSRWVHFAIVPAALFAAEGWRAFREGNRGRRVVLGTLAMLTLMTLGAWALRGRIVGAVASSAYAARHAADAGFTGTAMERTVTTSLKRAAVAGPVSLAVVAGAAMCPAPVALALVSCWTIGDLVSAVRPYLDLGPMARFRVRDRVGEDLAARPGIFRTITDEDAAAVNGRMPLDLAFVSGHHAVPPSNVFRFAEAAARSGDARRHQSLLNVRYHVSYSRVAGKGLRLVKPSRDPWGQPVFIFEDPHGLPRVFFPDWGRSAAGFEAALAALSRPGWSWREAVLAGPAAPPAMYARARLRNLAGAAGTLSAEIEAEGAALAVVSEMAYPGWRAFLDERRVPVWRADALLMAVEIPPGRHRLRMLFRPMLFSLGLWLTALSTAACAAWAGSRAGA
ncbi:MAG: YfhO family protein [Candidatus Coatesbacteria bacterium]